MWSRGGAEKLKSELRLWNIYYFSTALFMEAGGFGPQHPASHGVLVIILNCSNEYLLFLDIHIGYLHRGTEKLLEFKSFEQGLPYFDRLDYVSVVFNEHLFSLAFESLLRCSLCMRVSYLRLLFLELTRVFNGLLCLACSLMDLGCMSPLL